jgi:Zn-finger nucleic acid-binding protein
MEAWRSKVKVVPPSDDDPVVVNPLTGRAMEKFEIGGVCIDRCPRTGAIWLDRGELARLSSLGKEAKALLKQIDRKPPRSQRRQRGTLVSPQNGTDMMIVVRDDDQPHIEFEMCPVSGGCFFDAGELADLTEYSFTEKLKRFFRT